jgi:hypothetical protein
MLGDMWWKLTGLALIEAALIALLFMPIQTHAVKLDMPANAPVASAATYALDAVAIIIPLLALLLFIAILGTPLWLAWRIVKKHRASRSRIDSFN